VLGTPDYMAPEQARNAREVDARADVYSLGCTLYTALTGQAVFAAKTPKEKVMLHADAPVPKLSNDVEGVSPELDQLFQSMLAKQPADRPKVEHVVRVLRGQ